MAIASSEFQEFVDGENIELDRTRGHPAFAERFIPTFKDKLFKRIENDEKNRKPYIQWIDYIDETMVTYNYKDVHSATGLTPNKARDKDNEFKSKLNISMKAKKERIYPTLEVGDRVKILRKKAITEKERTSHFLQGEYTVEAIDTKLNQQYYTLEGYNRPMRHELLKVKLPFIGNIFKRILPYNSI